MGNEVASVADLYPDPYVLGIGPPGSGSVNMREDPDPSLIEEK
jgi:hypothetical protein